MTGHRFAMASLNSTDTQPMRQTGATLVASEAVQALPNVPYDVLLVILLVAQLTSMNTFFCVDVPVSRSK